MAAAIMLHPQSSFSGACGPILRQSAASVLSSMKMIPENMQNGHYKETQARARNEKVVLVVQDSSFFNYTAHKATQGLGHIATREAARGVEAHTCLVLREDGLALGIIGQKFIIRKIEDRGRRHLIKQLPIEKKESYKWIEGLSYANARLSSRIKEIWVISDRESDIFEYMSSYRKPNVELLIRAEQPRIIEAEIEGVGHRGQLKKIIALLPTASRKTIEIERANRSQSVELLIAYSDIKLHPPQRKTKIMSPISMSVVYVREASPPSEADKPIEWVLLSTRRDLSTAQALKLVEYYAHRWKIERFHYTLKTGAFNVEALMFDDAHTLMNALALYSVLAWRVMHVCYAARVAPEAPCATLVDEVERMILEQYVKKKVNTAREAYQAIALLGGFLGGSKKYPNPGIKIIWFGLQRLAAMKLGWLLAQPQ